VYARLVDTSHKCFHYLMFMVNETKGILAAIFECISAFVDLKIRRTAPFPSEIAAQIEASVTTSAKLDWPAAISGAIHV